MQLAAPLVDQDPGEHCVQFAGFVIVPRYPGLHSVVQLGYVKPVMYWEFATGNVTGHAPAVHAVALSMYALLVQLNGHSVGGAMKIPSGDAPQLW